MGAAGSWRRFRYQADALCLVATGLYAFNRWCMKPWLGPGFSHDHFNDLLLVPAGLPWVLWTHARLGWREGDPPPTAREVGAHAVLWSLVCEGIAPRLIPHGTADWRDAAAYVAGGCVAWFWWNRPRPRCRRGSRPRRRRGASAALAE